MLTKGRPQQRRILVVTWIGGPVLWMQVSFFPQSPLSLIPKELMNKMPWWQGWRLCLTFHSPRPAWLQPLISANLTLLCPVGEIRPHVLPHMSLSSFSGRVLSSSLIIQPGHCSQPMSWYLVAWKVTSGYFPFLAKWTTKCIAHSSTYWIIKIILILRVAFPSPVLSLDVPERGLYCCRCPLSGNACLWCRTICHHRHHLITKSCLTLCSTMGCSMPGFPFFPEVCSDSCPFSLWCHLTISSSVTPFSCLQSFPASGSFPMNHPSNHVINVLELQPSVDQARVFFSLSLDHEEFPQEAIG